MNGNVIPPGGQLDWIGIAINLEQFQIFIVTGGQKVGAVGMELNGCVQGGEGGGII